MHLTDHRCHVSFALGDPSSGANTDPPNSATGEPPPGVATTAVKPKEGIRLYVNARWLVSDREAKGAFRDCMACASKDPGNTMDYRNKLVSRCHRSLDTKQEADMAACLVREIHREHTEGKATEANLGSCYNTCVKLVNLAKTNIDTRITKAPGTSCKWTSTLHLKPQVLCDKEPKGSAYAACLTRTKGPHLLFFMKSIHQANECLMGRPVPEHGPAGTGVPGTTQDHTPGTQSTTQAPPNSTGIKPMDVDGKRSTPAANSMGPLVYAVPPPRRVRLLYSFL